ncbi:ets DNA-binding protein pokkuri isoform X2 [Bemisia tabaci]|uniref:ets DNA-binding protein pokkuri isoform X2 n=1 Tax=Bemisia tabaci TaxID=7038 RepID=UPI003B288523
MVFSVHPFGVHGLHHATPVFFRNGAFLATDPRVWSREDVTTFLRWSETEFDLPRFDLELFQMNGKALCLLTKADLNERSREGGDVLYNIIQLLIREACSAAVLQSPSHLATRHCLPNSPVTPHFPLNPAWGIPPSHDFPALPTSTVPTSLHNSVTLSPAPSVDSQSGSPKNTEQSNGSAYPVLTGYNSGVSSGSNQSDSEQEEVEVHSPTPINLLPPPGSSNNSSPPVSPRYPPSFFASDPVSEQSNTNGRLLWDFLQQLLNDSLQRYTSLIAWRNRESGVFKIVDPPGLAKLWGIQKNHLSMNYDKMSRALRYYYRVNILKKVQGERHCYQFLRNPSELKNIKNISLLRQQISSLNGTNGTSGSNQSTSTSGSLPLTVPTFGIKSEPSDSNQAYADEPTDLSMGQSSRSSSSNVNCNNSSNNSNSSNSSSSSPGGKSSVDFHRPQDLSSRSPMHLQLNMRAKDVDYPSDVPSSPNLSAFSQMKMEASSS